MSNGDAPNEKDVSGCCPSCGPDRFAQILASEDESWSSHDVHGGITYRILKCGGCRGLYIQTETWCSEDWPDEEPKLEYWPKYSKFRPQDWFDEIHSVDKELYSLMEEVYKAAAHGLPVCAATAVRTAFDQAASKLKVDKGAGFSQKIDQLETKGHLSPVDKAVFLGLIDAGSAAAHRGWKPNEDELKTLIASLESFIHRAFVINPAVKKLKKRVPGRQKRVKKKLVKKPTP